MNTELMFSSKTDDWATPQEFFDKLNKEFCFDLDPCADKYNHKCETYFTKETNGLKQSWEGHCVFCNPPYGREIGKWVEKAAEEAKKPNTTVVMLIPARTDTTYFHEYIYKKDTEIRFIRGRLKFGKSKTSAPFPSMIVIFGKGNWRDQIKDLPSAQPEINCSEFPNNSDTISRQDAVSRRRLLSDLKELITAWEKYPVMAEQIKGVEVAIGYVELIPSAQPERTCVNCGRTANNGGWYADGRTRCPIEEHYALPKDGYCHLWEKRNITDDDYPERREDERPES